MTEPPIPDLRPVIQTLINANHPVIITEYAGRTAAGVDALSEIATLLGAPVFDGVDPLYCNIARAHPHYLGERPEAELSTADVILIAGATTPWFPPDEHVKPGTSVILMDDDVYKARLPQWRYPIQVRLPGRIEHNLTALTAAIRQTLIENDPQRATREARRTAITADHQKRFETPQRPLAVAPGPPVELSIDSFLSRLRAALPDDSLIIDETVSHSRPVRHHLGRPGAYIRVGSGGLGIGAAYAIGAKLAQPSRPVIFLVGDGTFHYNPIPAALGACGEYDRTMPPSPQVSMRLASRSPRCRHSSRPCDQP